MDITSSTMRGNATQNIVSRTADVVLKYVVVDVEVVVVVDVSYGCC